MQNNHIILNKFKEITMISQEKKELHQLIAEESEKIKRAIEFHEKAEMFFNFPDTVKKQIEACGMDIIELDPLLLQAKEHTVAFIRGNLNNFIKDQDKVITKLSKRLIEIKD